MFYQKRTYFSVIEISKEKIKLAMDGVGVA